jgi:error-prone DNA polymerase
VLTAAEILQVEQGSRVSIAGLVTCRQQPGTASGVVFITLEDETGFSNLILWNNVYERLRLVARYSTLLLAHGTVERQSEAPGERRGRHEREAERAPARKTSAPTNVRATAEVKAKVSNPVVHVIVSDLERLDVPEGRVRSFSRDFH